MNVAGDRPTRVGLALLLLGALAIGFAALVIAGTPTPDEGLSADPGPAELGEAIDRFRLTLDRQARLQALGLGLVTAGVAWIAAAAGTATRRERRGPIRARMLEVALASAALLAVARWMSVGEQQFETAWDHWVFAEAVAWVTWGVAVVVAAWPPGTAEQATGPPPHATSAVAPVEEDPAP